MGEYSSTWMKRASVNLESFVGEYSGTGWRKLQSA